MKEGALKEIWRGMGIFKWPIIALIGLGLAVTPFLGPPRPVWVDNGVRPFAGGTVRIETKGRLGEFGGLDLRLHAQGVPSGQAHVRFLGGKEASITFGQRSAPSMAQISLKPPAKTDRLQVSLSMKASGGAVHHATWDLGPPLPF